LTSGYTRFVRHVPFVLLAGSLAASCSASPPPALKPAAPATTRFDGHQRLDHQVVPTRYALEMTVDPSRETFHGSAIVDIVTERPTREVRMHAEGLGFWSATAAWAGKVVPARTLPGRNGGLTVQWDEPAAAGPIRLSFTYDAPYLDVPTGVFRVRQGEDAYVFTQFEALDARRAFPCFDQPEFKTPFWITLRVPTGLVALSNSPESGRRTMDGFDVVTFEPTEPLPTYLVAFAVGRFDVTTSAERSEVRVVSPYGDASLSALALRRAPRVLAALESYFGVAYPYRKLDLVAVPTMGGAMENAGLVTFADRILLVDEPNASTTDRLRLDAVVAHELAHSWFGNSVTLRWWDDLWLNEAFATWLQARVHTELAPEYEEQLRAQERARNVMHLDAQPGARAIRQPIRHGGDVENAFDGITYTKGAALLRMVEGWVSPEVFQRAVRSYVAAHEHGNATTEQLFTTLDRETGKPVSTVLQGFVNRPGLPWLKLRRETNDGHNRLVLEQVRAWEDGPGPMQGEPWNVPVCVRFENEGAVRKQCALLSGSTVELALPDGPEPAWVLPNADALGYYRWDLPKADWRSLVAASERLTTAERASLPDQLGQSLVAGTLDAATYLDLLGQLARHRDRFVVQAVMMELSQTEHALVPDDAEVAFEQFVRGVLGVHVRRLGLERRANEPTSDAMLRPWLLQAYATLGKDEEVLSYARSYADKLLADPQTVDLGAAEVWLSIAARGGDRSLWERLRGAIDTASNPRLRAHLVVALGSFEDPALLRSSLDLVLTGGLSASDYPALSRGQSARRSVQQTVWAWVKNNHRKLIGIMGESSARGFPTAASGFCDEAKAREMKAFFANTGTWPTGTQQHVNLTGQAIERCARARRRLAPEMGRALQRR
jgi:aminopeptidase N